LLEGLRRVAGFGSVDGNGHPGRVLMIAPEPCFDSRGTPMRIFQWCRALTDLGYEVHLATYPMGDQVSLPGLIYHRIPRIPGVRSVPVGFSLTKALLDAILALEVFGLFLSKRFVAVHAVEEAALFAVPLASIFRTPVIADIHSDMSDQLLGHRLWAVRFLGVVMRGLQKGMLRYSQGAVTVCRSLTELVEGVRPGATAFQIEDIPFVSTSREPDLQEVERLRGELNLWGRRPIVYTGNLASYQGVDLLVDAVPTLVACCRDAVVVIVGGGREGVERLRQRAESLGVAGSLRLVGEQPADAIPEYLALGEVLVSPRSAGENTPLKIYSYMLSGRPLVATDLPTHTQVLDAETAFLTPATPEGLANGLVRALEDSEAASRIAQRAKEKVERDHNYESLRRKLGEAYAFVTR
jgi:glycosyltransferase involved in cell wall biosynthesis